MRRPYLDIPAACLAIAFTAFAQSPQPQFKTGQAARALIGQTTFTVQSAAVNARTLGAASGLAYSNGILVVADSARFIDDIDANNLNNRNRVLIFRNIPGQVPALDTEIPPYVGRCPVCGGQADVVVGQPDFDKVAPLKVDAASLRNPTAVATDGTRLVVADTDYNRVLIWNSIPTQNGQPANVVLGQENFTSIKRITLDNRSFRGPQGVWIANGRLFVADTQNHRVLVWNSIPTQNHAPADLVLGQPNFTTAPDIDLTKGNVDARADNMLNPVSVTSDGIRLYVSDLGHNRVLIFNSIPTRNAQPADVVIGQADFTSAVANNSEKLCSSNGEKDGKPTYPRLCAATLDFPRFALSDGRRLFISDGGNDRVLVYNEIPTSNGKAADAILGQFSADTNLTSDSAFPERVSSSDSFRTPAGLAFDGQNLYVSDPFNRRVVIYTPAQQLVPATGVRNAASREIFAVGLLTFAGSIKENDELTVKIGEKEYKYKIVKDDNFAKIITAVTNLINANGGDPLVLATPNSNFNSIVLTARIAGSDGNNISTTTSTSTGATVTVTASGATLAGGQDAARIAPGTIVTILGDNLAETTQSVEVALDGTLPTGQQFPLELAGVQVYFDGIRAPVLFVSPTEIRAQMPWEISDTTSVTAWVRTKRRDGTTTVSSAIGVPIIGQNPGIFSEPGVDPRPGLVYHGSSFSQGTISVDGTAVEGDKARVFINDRQYEYVVKKDDTLAKVRDGLIEAINADGGDPQVVAFPAGVFTRIRLRARIEGPAGNDITIRGSAVDKNNAEAAQVIMTATNSRLCCANRGGSRVTESNPALPGETIIVYATGLGLPKGIGIAELLTGDPFRGSDVNEPIEFVASLAGGRTANVIFARLIPGQVGVYEVQLELNSDLPNNPATQLTIAQSFQVSNIVTFPVLRTDQ